MARPRTPLGSTGHASLSGQVKRDGKWVAAEPGERAERWRARTKVRDADGQLRDVERYASSKAKAETLLKLAIADRQAPARGNSLSAGTTVEAAGLLWLEQVNRADSNLSDYTRKQYAGSYARYIVGSTIANLTLREANRVPVLRPYLQGVADKHGTGSAKSARSVVSGILRLAVTDGVLEYVATRDIRPAKASQARITRRDTTRALTRAERDHLIATADGDAQAVELDMADVVAFMAGTGVRISEALGRTWADVDLDAGTVRVLGTKSKAAKRVLSLPPWLVDRLRTRAEYKGSTGHLFASPGTSDTSRPRDRSNALHEFRRLLDEAGFPWATSHTLRRTVASLLDEAGLPIALAADQLGHADPSMTARVYLGRKVDMSAAAKIL